MEEGENNEPTSESPKIEDVLYKYMNILKKLELIICVGVQSIMVEATQCILSIIALSSSGSDCDNSVRSWLTGCVITMALYIIVYAITWYASTKKIQDVEKLQKLAKAYLGFQAVYGLFWLCWFITGNIFVYGDSMCYEDWPVGYAIGAVILATGYVCIVLLCCLLIMLKAALRSKSDDEEEAEVKKTKIERDLDPKSDEKDESRVNLKTINTHENHSKHNPHIRIPPPSNYYSQPPTRPAEPTSPKVVKQDYEAKMHNMVKRLKTDLETIKSKPQEKSHLNSQEIKLELEVDQPPTFGAKFRYHKK